MADTSSTDASNNSDGEIILKVTDLKMHFPLRQGMLQRVVGTIKAVDGISFELREREVMGLVGESGCGKTTVGRAILRFYDPTDGEVLFHRANGDWVDVAKLSRKEMKALRQEMRMIFQDPFSSLNPRLSVKDLISEPIVIHGTASGAEITARVAELMEAVGLKPAYMGRYPHEFSGGQRQRIGVARTLALFSLVIAMAIFLMVNWAYSLIVAARGQERAIPVANRIVARLFGNVDKTKPAGINA